MQENLTFIGGGNMAASLIGGLVAADHPAERIRVVEPDPARREALTSRFGVQCKAAASAALLDCDAAVLAVKPQVMQAVARALPAVPALVISIAAGIRSDALSAWLPAPAALVRCMPNTPSLIGAGATGLYAGDGVSEDQRALADAIMRTAGSTVWVEDEALLDSVTAVSGSGPAYFFRLYEAMQAQAETMGLPADTARALVLQTALGAARMALESGDDPATLRKNVTSPGGTTERALASFEQDSLEAVIGRGMQAARDRSISLSDELAGTSTQEGH
ncbi:MAG: pyrroline-5-carboxylate reductase [Salinisphaeraceae bacterium]|nr:pyrroline-5-carboxylate reductase [Salinisphaeraceae bacterium]